MATKFKALDIVDFPSDPNRVFGDARKHLLLAIRKIRRRYDDGHDDYAIQLKELLEFSMEVINDYTEEEVIEEPIIEPVPCVADDSMRESTKPTTKTRAKRKGGKQ